ncbi:hypothetical protein DYB97_14415 [Vibrio cholerae]|nr:hypothetical protein [Vibrio cholerae]
MASQLPTANKKPRQWQGPETKKAARRQLWYCWKIYRKLVGNSTVVDEEMNWGSNSRSLVFSTPLDKCELESAVYLACIGLVNVCQKHQNKTQDLTALILKVNSMCNKVSNDIIE